jgi:hypothetical protein
LFLWEIDNQEPDFWSMKQGALFMHVRIIFHLTKPT